MKTYGINEKSTITLLIALNGKMIYKICLQKKLYIK